MKYFLPLIKKFKLRVGQKKINHNSGYTLIEIAIALAVLGMITGGVLYTLSTIRDVKAINDSKKTLDKIQAALNTYVAKNGYAPCPASRTAAQGSSTYGAATDCTAVASAGVADYGSGSAQIRIGTVPTRALDLTDDDMIDGWNNRITYAVIKQLAQNSANYNAYSNTTTDTFIIRDVNGNRINSAVADNNHVLYLLISHGKKAHGAYTDRGTNVVACGSYKDSENCNDDNIFIDSTYNPNATNYYDNYVRWKTKSQAGLESQTFASVTQTTCGGSGYTPTPFTPTSVSGLRLWLDASDAATMFSDANCTTAAATGSKIRCWKDKSGNLYNATQTANGAANNPTWQGTSITFAGKKPFFSISGGIFPANTTISALDIFIVMSATSAGGYALYYPTASVISAMIPNSSSQTVWQFGGTTFTSAWGGATGSIYLWNFMSSATATTKFWRSDTNLNNSSTAITTTSSGTANFYIGCDTTGLSNAINCSEPVINEILIYNSMLSDNDRVNIRKYLKAKWTTLAY